MRSDDLSEWQLGEPVLTDDFPEIPCPMIENHVSTWPQYDEWLCDFERRLEKPSDATWSLSQKPEPLLVPLLPVNSQTLEAKEAFTARTGSSRLMRVDGLFAMQPAAKSQVRKRKRSVRATPSHRSRLERRDAVTEEDYQRYAALVKQKRADINRFSGWGAWANTDERRVAVLKSQNRQAIAQVKDWGAWANTDKKRIQLLRTEYADAISQVKDWGSWADSDDKKTAMLHSRCHRAIESVPNWKAYATTDEHRITLLRSKCSRAIQQIDDWNTWAVTDRKKIALLRSNCALAIAQVKTWASWAVTDQRMMCVLRSAGSAAKKHISYASWLQWANTPRRKYLLNAYYKQAFNAKPAKSRVTLFSSTATLNQVGTGSLPLRPDSTTAPRL